LADDDLTMTLTAFNGER